MFGSIQPYNHLYTYIYIYIYIYILAELAFVPLITPSSAHMLPVRLTTKP